MATPADQILERPARSDDWEQHLVKTPVLIVFARNCSSPLSLTVKAPDRNMNEYMMFPPYAKLVELDNKELRRRVFVDGTDDSPHASWGDREAWGHLAQMLDKTLAFINTHGGCEGHIEFLAYPDGRTEDYDNEKHHTLIFG